MKPQDFHAEPDDLTWWSAEGVVLPSRPAIRINVVTEGERPDADQIAAIERCLAEIDRHVAAASPLILDNYSYEHFKKLGIAEDRLVKDETPQAIAQAVRLEEASFYDAIAGTFELSFSAPWDDHHSFNVEFEEGEPVTCAVNG